MIQFHVLELRIEVNVYDPRGFSSYLRGSEDHTQSFQSAVLIHEIQVLRSYHLYMIGPHNKQRERPEKFRPTTWSAYEVKFWSLLCSNCEMTKEIREKSTINFFPFFIPKNSQICVPWTGNEVCSEGRLWRRKCLADMTACLLFTPPWSSIEAQ